MNGWQAALSGVEATALDCMQANLAVLADHSHGGGTHRRLGAPLRFPFARPDDTYLPTVERALGRHVADAHALAGVRLHGIDEPRTIERAFQLLDAAAGDRTGALYVVADAYTLPWCPYSGHQHMPHSFLLVPGQGAKGVVVDAYHNDTPYGPARPRDWTLDRDELIQVLSGQPIRVGEVEAVPAVPPGPVDVLRRNASHLTEAQPRMREFVQAYRDHADPLAAAEALMLESWLLARSRLLHGRWLSDAAPARLSEPFARHAEAWTQFAGHCYLAVRRLRRGREAPADLYDVLSSLLDEDVRHASRLAGAPSSSSTAA
ncbi:hypothetical protein ACFWM7_33990 [Streptomyces sp. NPDC058375]|uniref:hypothetical protein n=1 Tax=Streptomyces sp. NPDC058375 TaxID=3346467 RepID=UPI003659C706